MELVHSFNSLPLCGVEKKKKIRKKLPGHFFAILYEFAARTNKSAASSTFVEPL